MKTLTRESAAAAARAALFNGAQESAAISLLYAAGGRERAYADGEVILRQGDENRNIYILIAGAAAGEHLTADGRAVTVNEMAAGDVFGDVLSGSGARSPVEVVARGGALAVRFPLAGIFAPCDDCRGAQEVLLRNLIAAISEKYFELNRRVSILLKSSLRARAAAYLLRYAGGEDWFSVPHTREEQSRYLGCDRSALSRELSRMRREGLIDYRQKRFRVTDMPAVRRLAE